MEPERFYSELKKIEIPDCEGEIASSYAVFDRRAIYGSTEEGTVKIFGAGLMCQTQRACEADVIVEALNSFFTAFPRG